VVSFASAATSDVAGFLVGTANPTGVAESGMMVSIQKDHSCGMFFLVLICCADT
jgi:hypothetical protein